MLIQDLVQVMELEKSKYQVLDLRMIKRSNAKLMEFLLMQLHKNGMKLFARFPKQGLAQHSSVMLDLKFQSMEMTGMYFREDFNIMNSQLLRKFIQLKDLILEKVK